MGSTASKERPLCIAGAEALKDLLGMRVASPKLVDFQAASPDVATLKQQYASNICCQADFCKTLVARRLIAISDLAFDGDAESSVWQSLQQAVDTWIDDDKALLATTLPLLDKVTMSAPKAAEAEAPAALEAGAVPAPALASYTIAAVTFNTQSYPYPKNADFVQRLVQQWQPTVPDLVVVALQEDASNSNLITAFQTALEDDDYTNVAEAAAMGVGATTSTKGARRGLRLAVFARGAQQIQVAVGEPMFCAPNQPIETLGLEGLVRGKGGVHVRVTTHRGRLDLIDMHLPFDAASIGTPRRPEALQFQLACMDYVYTTSVYNPDDSTIPYVLTMGDLNFRAPGADWKFPGAVPRSALPISLRPPEPESVVQEIRDNYQAHDELFLNRLSVDKTFQEGVDGGGIEFWPTCKMCTNRGQGCKPQSNPCKVCKAKAKGAECKVYEPWRSPPTSVELPESCYAPERAPIWCDRILYSPKIRCIAYDRYDEDSINLSDHAAVWGLFELQ